MESMSCHLREARAPHDHERIRNFMKLKRQKTKSELKAKKEEDQYHKTKVQQRLLALEMNRRSKVHYFFKIIRNYF